LCFRPEKIKKTVKSKASELAAEQNDPKPTESEDNHEFDDLGTHWIFH
jgi:hypothetical protein